MSPSLRAFVDKAQARAPRNRGVKLMRLDKTASKLAVVAALAFAFAAQAVASASQPAAGAHRRHVRDRPHGRVS